MIFLTFTMAAVNIPNFRDDFFSLSLPEKSLKKNLSINNLSQDRPQPALFITNQTTDQAFYDALTEIALDSLLQNEVANIKQYVLEAQTIILQT